MSSATAARSGSGTSIKPESSLGSGSVALAGSAGAASASKYAGCRGACAGSLGFDSLGFLRRLRRSLIHLRMAYLIGLIYAVHILVCFFLIIVVLLQSGKSGDIAAAFGGMGSQTAFGPRGAATALSKATTWSAVLFMVTSITLSIFAVRRSGTTPSSGSVLSGVKPSTTNTQPANPTQPPTTPASQPNPTK